MTSLDLNDLFLRGLKDICHAEKRVLKSLPKMAKAATSVRLRAAFEKHHEETEVQIERLEQILDLLGKHGRGKRCDSIKGLLNGLKDLEADYGGTIALDAGLVAAAQSVEHYEIARYGTLMAWAANLSNPEAVRLLSETLREEKNMAAKLVKIGKSATKAGGT